MAALLRSWKSDPVKMAEFDLDPSGDVDAEEWDAARAAALQQVGCGGGMSTVQDRLVNLDDGRLFLISARNERELAQRWRRIALACLSLAFVSGAVSVAVGSPILLPAGS